MELGGTESDGATRGVQVLGATRADGFEGLTVDARGVRDAVIEVKAHNVGVEQLRHAANVIGMWVARDDQIDGVDVKGRKVCADAGRTGVDDRGVAALLDDGGVALANVEEMNVELLGGERSREDRGEDSEQVLHAARNLLKRSAR
jgi:hypothetical protein